MPDRIQREVEELLAKLDTLPPPRGPFFPRVRRSIGDAFGRVFGGIHLPNLSAGHVLLAAIALIVVVYLAGGKSDIARWLIAGGVIAFIGAFLFSLRRQSRPPEKYWRGQALEPRRRGSGEPPSRAARPRNPPQEAVRTPPRARPAPP